MTDRHYGRYGSRTDLDAMRRHQRTALLQRAVAKEAYRVRDVLSRKLKSAATRAAPVLTVAAGAGLGILAGAAAAAAVNNDTSPKK